MPLESKTSPYILGIDFGTCNSVVSVFYGAGGGSNLEKARVIEVEGDSRIPSVVCFQDENTILVGHAARRLAVVNPESTVSSIKRVLGDARWKREFFGKEYQAVDIAAMIFEKLLNGVQAQTWIDLKGTPRFAVVCIPANSDDIKKKLTIEAAHQAGLKVLRLLEEPTAAAIAYGFERGREQTIMVYDLGGGTFDCTILEVHTSDGGEPHFMVRAKEGIAFLGGDDFDQEIMKILNAKFMEKTGIDLLDDTKDQGVSIAKLRNARWLLKEAAESAKKELSEAELTTVSLPNLLLDGAGRAHSLMEEIGREEFEGAIIDMLQATQRTMGKALEAAGLTIQDIDKIVLVGGSTRIPLVKRLVAEMWGRDPYQDVNPDTCIAQGAAIFGASLVLPEASEREQGDQLPQKFIIEDQVTHYLGLETVGRKFNVLINKGTEIKPGGEPVTFSRIFTTAEDDITSLRLSVYQSLEAAEYVDAPGVVCLGDFYFNGLPAAKRGEMKLEVTFTITQENLLQVKSVLLNDPEKQLSVSIER